MTTITLLKALRAKLKVGNTNSIHLNALPGRSATKLDVSDFNFCSKNLADEFLEMLTNKAHFDFDIAFKNTGGKEIQSKLAILAKRINSIIIQNKDEFEEHGVKTFGFGYPILVKRLKSDPKRIIKAPIFIWQLDIERNPSINSWKIIRNKSKNNKGNLINDSDIHDIAVNEVLLSFLNSEDQVSIPRMSDDMLDDFVLDKAEIISEIKRIMSCLTGELNNEQDYNITTKINGYIESLPSKPDIDEKDFTEPYILNSGVFGLYRSQKESIIKDTDNCIDKISQFQFEKLRIENINTNPHSSIETDPSQQQILNSIGLEPQKIIQGPPGTGKSQTLTALITNAMANNLKCLVVCEKKTALDVIYKNISKENSGLANLVAIVDDIVKDREHIVGSVRDRIGNKGQNAQPNEQQYNTLKNNIENTARAINTQHTLLDRRLYSGQKWPDLVGVFLKKRREAQPDFLNKFLNYKDYQFQRNEYELPRLIENISAADNLFRKVKLEGNPFEKLNDQIFLPGKTARATQLDLNKELEAFCQELENISLRINTALKAYEYFLFGHFEDYYKSVKTKVEEFRSYCQNNKEIYGESFFKNDSFAIIKIEILGLFSAKYKQLKQNKSKVSGLHNEVRIAYQVHQYFAHIFTEIKKNESYELLLHNIEQLNTVIDNWHNNVPLIVDGLVREFASGKLHESFSHETPSIRNIETDFYNLKTQTHMTRLLKFSLMSKDTLNEIDVEIRRYLLSVKEIIDSKEDFLPYFEWRQFFIGLKPIEQNTVIKLIESQSRQWLKHFESWYYFWLLDQNEDRLLPKSDDKIDEFKILKPQLKVPQTKNIIWQWEQKQNLMVQKAKSESRNPVSLYNKRGSKGEKRNSLRKIIETDFDLFTSFFPVVMTNPSTCSSILPLKEALFDIVIFDEASQLRIEDTFTSMLRGKVKVVSGDSQQMPPSSYFAATGGDLTIGSTEDDDESIEQTVIDQQRNESLSLADSESLLDYADRNGFKSTMLKVHYRSQHRDLIEFSNHAFYGNQLIPVPPVKEYKSIEFHEVNGLYKDQQNTDEAKFVIDLLLNHIELNENGKYPSVGIATLNLKQRNLIVTELDNLERESTNLKHIKKIQELRGADTESLFVKNLENIQGDERDIIILSTTFGLKEDGSYRQNFGPLGQSQGHKLLNVLITRAKQKVFVCCSIPQSSIAQYKELIEQNGTKGKGIFYAYLAYAKAISDNDRDSSTAILQHILKHSPSKGITETFDEYDGLGSESPFEDEVYYDLSQRIGKERIVQQHKVGSFRIDMVVKSKVGSNPVIAIECDGYSYHSSNEAYAWDIFRQKELEKMGFKFHRIWSTNWWNDHKRELENLVKFIDDVDREESIKKNATT